MDQSLPAQGTSDTDTRINCAPVHICPTPQPPCEQIRPPTPSHRELRKSARKVNPAPTPPHPHLFRTFNLYGPPKPSRAINEAIKAELLKPYPRDTGFIYGFHHPLEDKLPFRLGTGPLIAPIQPCSSLSSPSPSSPPNSLIKIGRTDKISRRLEQWRKQCKYTPQLVFAHAMAQHQRIERIVHHQLHNSRLREVRGCLGCGARHTEWFRVEAGAAEELVQRWQGWLAREPYDSLGDLKPCWLERLHELDLDDVDCWTCFCEEGLLAVVE